MSELWYVRFMKENEEDCIMEESECKNKIIGISGNLVPKHSRNEGRISGCAQGVRVDKSIFVAAQLSLSTSQTFLSTQLLYHPYT